MQDTAHRERHIELWLGATDESLKLFVEACRDLVPKLVHDLEVTSGIHILQRIAEQTLEVLQPSMDKYHTDDEYGRVVSQTLRDTLFPWHDEAMTASSYGTLVTLQGLMIYLSNTQGHLLALKPAAQALWDDEFVGAVQTATTNVMRCQSWVTSQITIRAPQTLIVPSKIIWRKEAEKKMDEGEGTNGGEDEQS